MKRSLAVLGLAAMLALGIAGCSGDDGAQGPPGPQGPAGPAGPPGPNAVVLTPTTDPATFADLRITAKVTSVSISSPPVVKFSLADHEGKPIVGFGQQSTCFPYGQTTNPYVAKCYANLAFSLAKLVPGSNGSPSKWVSYIVTTPPRQNSPTVVGLDRPTTDSTGTLVDNGDGTYTYTFYRDVPGIKAQVDGITPPAGSNKADLGDLTYDPSLTHRLTIQIAGNAPGTGTNTPSGAQTVPGVPLKNVVDVVYDFIPATGKPVTASDFQRDINPNAACESCHSTLGGIPGDSSESSGAAFHGGSRNNVQYCVVCHTDQRRYGRTEAAFDPNTLTLGDGGTANTYIVDGRALGDMPNMIHKTHLGSILAKNGYNYVGVQFDKGGYSQDIRNCQKCHDSAGPTPTPQGGNWKTNPNRLACGGCHDGINFATGTGVKLRDAAKGLTSTPNAHEPGPLADDSLCTICHGEVSSTGQTRIDKYHLPVTPPNTGSSLHVAGGNSNTNAAWIASNASRLPEGAIKVTYDVKSVSAVADGSGVKRPVMVFRMLQNGARKDLNTVATAAVNPVTGQKEIWDNFMGAPSVYFVFAVPQDGISKPADFNASVSSYLRCLWNGSAPEPDPDVCVSTGTLTGPDADGYYTATLTAAIIPNDAVMLTGGLGYSYNVRNTLPLTQTNLTDYPATKSTVSGLTAGMPNAIGGLIVIAPNVQRVAAGFTGRRAIVEDAKCNACHQELGTFTEDAFHGGQRNDGTTCSWCHTPNRASSGWTAETGNMTHAIHGGAKRSVSYTWHSVSATENFSTIVYPGILARCQQCHLPGTYDFVNSASADAAGLGADQTNKRQYREVASGTLSATDISLSPYVTAGVNYGARFSFNANTGVTTPGAATNLVTSPTMNACVACHDTNLAVSHMTLNGGSFYEARSTAIGKQEQCFVCHASDRSASITAVHAR